MAKTALSPITSPGPAILRIMVLPSREVEEIFTWPKQMTNTLRAGSPLGKELRAPRVAHHDPDAVKIFERLGREIAKHSQMAMLTIYAIFRGVMGLKGGHTFCRRSN